MQNSFGDIEKGSGNTRDLTDQEISYKASIQILNVYPTINCWQSFKTSE